MPLDDKDRGSPEALGSSVAERGRQISLAFFLRSDDNPTAIFKLCSVLSGVILSVPVVCHLHYPSVLILAEPLHMRALGISRFIFYKDIKTWQLAP